MFTRYPKASNCEVCLKTKNRRSAWTRLHVATKFGDLFTAVHKILNVEKRFEMRTQKHALIVQGDFTNWIQSYPVKTTETTETLSCLLKFLPPSLKPDRIFTVNSNEVLKKLVKIHNGIVTQGTSIALLQSGLPEKWWDCALCYLPNLHDKMADGKTAFDKRDGQKFDGP